MKKLRIDRPAMLVETHHGAARTWLPPLVVLGVLTTAVSCTTTFLNVGYCATTNGDVFCANRHPDDGRLYCIWGSRQCRVQLANEYLDEREDFDGCIAAPPPSGGDECYSPCGGGPEFQENGLGCPAGAGTTGAATETATETEMSAGTSGAMTSTSATGTSADGTAGTSSGCAVDGDCEGDPGGPFCDEMSGACVTCDGLEGDMTCAGVDMQHPLCVEGACVACTSERDEVCTDGGQVCDAEANECVDCKVHEDCGDDWACHIFERTCFPDSPTTTVVMINDTNDDIAARIDDIPAGSHGIILLETPSGSAYNIPQSVVVDEERIVAILGNYGSSKPWIRREADGTAAIHVKQDSTLYLQGIRIARHDNVTATPLACTGPGARLDVRGSIITDTELGTTLTDCEARLENSFFQSDLQGTPALSIEGDSETEVIFATIVSDATGAGGIDAALACSGNSMVSLKNSLVLTHGGGNSPEIEDGCAVLTMKDSLIEHSPAIPGNITLEPPLPLNNTNNYRNWFSDFGAGDLHLDTDAIGDTLDITYFEVAAPGAGDSPIDIDGEDRSMSAYPGMVGADAP